MNLLILIVPLAIGGSLILRQGRLETGLILAALVVQLLAWMFTTHLQARFLLPIAVPLALLAGRATQGLHVSAEGPFFGALRIATGVLVGIHALCAMFLLLPEAGLFGGAVAGPGSKPRQIPSGQLFERIYNVADEVESDGRADASREARPPEHVLLIGDGTPWMYRGEVSYFTVFDTNPAIYLLQKNPQQFLDWAQAKGVHYVVVNWFELARLNDTYGLDVNLTVDGFWKNNVDRWNKEAAAMKALFVPQLEAAGLQDVHLGENPYSSIYRVPRARGDQP